MRIGVFHGLGLLGAGVVLLFAGEGWAWALILLGAAVLIWRLMRLGGRKGDRSASTNDAWSEPSGWAFMGESRTAFTGGSRASNDSADSASDSGGDGGGGA